MTNKFRTLRNWSCLVLVACSGPALLLGCAEDGASEDGAVSAVHMPLTAIGADGTVYQLSNATFSFVGPTTTSVTSGVEAVLDVDLAPGNYQVTLEPGWVLLDDTMSPVDASLLSPNPQAFALASSAQVSVVFQFLLDGGIVETGNGTAQLSIDVIEGAPAGYYENDGVRGYAFTASDNVSTISPADFSEVPAGGPFCASGTVVAQQYAGFALVGMNLNQPMDATQAASPMVPSSSGLYVDVANPGGSLLRLHLQDDVGNYWCAAYAGAGLYPWSSFTRECWSPGGEPYASQPITSLLVVVPDDLLGVPFNFCLNEIGQVE